MNTDFTNKDELISNLQDALAAMTCQSVKGFPVYSCSVCGWPHLNGTRCLLPTERHDKLEAKWKNENVAVERINKDEAISNGHIIKLEHDIEYYERKLVELERENSDLHKEIATLKQHLSGK